MKTKLRIEVEHDDAIDPDAVATAVSRMLEVGAADASDSAEDENLDDDARAEGALAASLEVSVFLEPA